MYQAKSLLMQAEEQENRKAQISKRKQKPFNFNTH